MPTTPCGVFKVEQIPADQVGAVMADFLLDLTPDKVKKEEASPGSWTVTATYPDCPDGTSPATTKTFKGS
jgi:hypothetical protein